MEERITVSSKKPVSIKENLISHKRKTDFRSNSSPVNRILYLQRTIGNQAVQRMVRSGALQAKLRIGQPGDMYEQEADRMADAVMRMPEPGVQRQVEPEEEEMLQTKPIANQITPLVQVQRQEEPEEEEETLQAKPLAEEITPLVQKQIEPEEEEEELQAKATSGRFSEVNSNLESHIQSFKGGGQPLSENDRGFFEPRFGRDFSQVRVHTDGKAAKSAREVNAKAYTLGKDVVFGAGQYAPRTSEGKRLLAHELTHVVQQSGDGHTMRRGIIDKLKEAAERKAEEIAKYKLGKLANEPVGPPSGFTGYTKCGPTFCQPFTSKRVAAAKLIWAGPLILAGIAKKVNTRVVPLWAAYLWGGSPPKNLTADFGKDFTASPTTTNTTKFLVGELRKDIEINQTALMGGAATVTIDFTPRLPAALAEIDDPAAPIPPQMNFNIPADIAGNVAGGIGKDQTSFPIGAKPSPFNDSREAVIKATLTRNADGSLTVAPAIKYTVKDTIDLCPGDCGTSAEQVATVPLSRFEATGLSGDVPLIVKFDAPASELTPFLIKPIAPPMPVVGTVKASILNIRSAPSTSSSIVGGYPKSTKIAVICRTTGTLVDGNDTWFKTNKGFVSARYITLSGAATPISC